MRRREAFTLIEMLVVISIIGILAGLTFKMMQLAKRNADRAATVAKLEKVAHALNEFRAEYGMYPPVKPGVCTIPGHGGCRICYQYEDTNKQSSAVCGKLDDDPTLANLFDMGLVAFLEKRDRGGIRHTGNPEWVPDTDRDELAKERWSIFIDGVIGDGIDPTNKISGVTAGYFNSSRTIIDSWFNVIHYESDPPYLSYRLWSTGPTGAPEDDLHKDTWDN